MKCLARGILLVGQFSSKLNTTAHNPAAINVESFGDEVVTRVCLADVGSEGTLLLGSCFPSELEVVGSFEPVLAARTAKNWWVKVPVNILRQSGIIFEGCQVDRCTYDHVSIPSRASD